MFEQSPSISCDGRFAYGCSRLLDGFPQSSSDILLKISSIMLRLKDKILIIDAKYYGRIMLNQFEKESMRSNHLYQIFTYVKNQDRDNTGDVAGILLYAKTDEDITPDCMFNMGGNQIGAKTLDLNKEFSLIAAQLDKIAWDYFEIKAA